MKKLNNYTICLFILLSGSLNAQENFFYELHGLEDKEGITHLFYRYINYSGSDCNFNNNFSFYHFHTSTHSDSLQIQNYLLKNSECKSEGIKTNDILFFKAHPDSFMTYSSIIKNGLIQKVTNFKNIDIDISDKPEPHKVLYDSTSKKVLISILNDESTYLLPINSHQIYDAKLNFESLNKISMPVNGIEAKTGSYIGQDNNYLYYSENRGLDFQQYSDTFYSKYEFIFTEDSTKIYMFRKSQDGYSNELIIIDFNNFRFQRTTIIEGYNFVFQLDKSIPNKIYVSESKSLKLSEDFGSSFDVILKFDSDITGLYKKPNSEILYVLTKTDLYKVENGQPTSIKQVPVSNEENPEIPTSVSLKQNYPNPFNPTTTIRFELDQATFAKLTVYDLLGRKVRELVNEIRPAGTNTIQFDAANLASGIYLYRLEANGAAQTKRLTLIK